MSTFSTVPQLAPLANAGPNRLAGWSDTVILDGSASFDPDGTIASYQWSQLDGPSVALSGGNTPVATFTAPIFESHTPLSFVLTVTDNDGQVGQDRVTILVIDDLLPPTTTGNFVRSLVQGKTYFDVSLITSRPAVTYFRLNGQASITAGGDNHNNWQIYNGPLAIALDKNGIASFEYYSVDSFGFTETPKERILQ